MARRHVPTKPELLIGILDSRPHNNTPSHIPVDIAPSELRVDYLTYMFDDIDEQFMDYVLLDKETAGEILTDFSNVRRNIKSLAVHCRVGLSRSPALAAALNDRFSLGYDIEYFLANFPGLNKYVCRTVIRTGLELGF